MASKKTHIFLSNFLLLLFKQKMKIWKSYISILGFPCGSVGKESACSAGAAATAAAKSLQSCPTLCDPVDCSPPGSSIHGIVQARVLEWDAVGDLGSIPGLGGSPGERNDNPLQYH